MLDQIHVLCEEAVKLTSDCPEFTVGSWVTSAFLMLLQVFFLVKKFIFGKKATKEVKEEEEIELEETAPEIIKVPYVPPDTIYKLLKLINEQDVGWRHDSILDTYGRNTETLHYGPISIRKDPYTKAISIYHSGTQIDMRSKSLQFDFDQVLLKAAFDKRFNKEHYNQVQRKKLEVANAEANANKELTNIIGNM